MDAQFWAALFEIIAVNIVLSGDNAIVIALACRSLPPRQQRMGVMLGAGAAIAMRVAFTAVAVTLMSLPTVGVFGGGLLLWIGWNLLASWPRTTRARATSRPRTISGAPCARSWSPTR